MSQPAPKSEIILYQTEDQQTRVQVRFQGETAWLSLNQMADLFQRDKSVISKHIKNLFEEGELRPEATVAKFATVQTEGDRTVGREIEFYNLDVIITGFDAPITEHQFAALVRYNERHGCAFFDVGHHRLHFGSFVGVVQVGKLAIEILPKLDSDESPTKAKWQHALLQMLRQSGLLAIESAPEADLYRRKSPLVDVYLDAFLSDVERLTHAGLVKRYRLTAGNLHKLKGRVLFPQQIRLNSLHQERIFTAHETYDRDNTFNRILKCALAIVQRLAIRQSLVARAGASLLWFEDVAEARITPQTFDRLPFGRNTERYRRAIQLARLIILNYSPDLRGGREHIFAILFGMNELFERYVFVHLRRAQPLYENRRLRITGQASRRFWSSKTIRPDIVADFQGLTPTERVILDTKWKVPRDGQPADDDLKQMYTYNVHFGGRRSVLVYPSAGPHQIPADEPYARSGSLPLGHSHSCATYYLNLFTPENRLRKDIGNELIEQAVLNTRYQGPSIKPSRATPSETRRSGWYSCP